MPIYYNKECFTKILAKIKLKKEKNTTSKKFKISLPESDEKLESGFVDLQGPHLY
jgi:hypothetical protein